MVMALVMPPAMTMAIKVSLINWRLGMPKLMLLAPQTVLQPNSSRIMRIMLMRSRPAVAIAPMGIASGSTTTS